MFNLHNDVLGGSGHFVNGLPRHPEVEHLFDVKHDIGLHFGISILFSALNKFWAFSPRMVISLKAIVNSIFRWVPRHPLLIRCVGHIVFLRAEPHMIRVNTSPVVASVETSKTIRDMAVVNLPRDSVTSDGAIGKLNTSIAVLIHTANPLPTMPKTRNMSRNWTSLINLVKKPLENFWGYGNAAASECNRIHSMILSSGSRTSDFVRGPFLFSHTT